MTTPMRFDLAIIGHFAVDEIVIADESRTSPGGAVYYGGIAAANLGYRTAVVILLAGKDGKYLDDFSTAGVAVYPSFSEKTSGIRNTYLDPTSMDRRICEPLAFAGPFTEENIPDLSASVIHVGPIMAGEVDLALLEAICRIYPKVALDLQGFLRIARGKDLVFEDWAEKERGLKGIDTVKADSLEAEVISGSADIYKAARTIAGYGPREVMITHADGVLVYANGQFFEAPFTDRGRMGRTGRGDTCISTYLCARTRHPIDISCKISAAVTSLKIEIPGPYHATRTELATKLQKDYGVYLQP